MLRSSTDFEDRRRLVGTLTHAAAVRGELLVCACRFLFCALVLTRFWALRLAVPPYATALKVAMCGLAMSFSLGIWSAIRRGRCTPRWLAISVWADALMCGSCLLGTVLWPGIVPYGGMLTRPEPMAILIMVFTSGFRLSARLALLGGALNSLIAALLLVADRANAPTPLGYGWAEMFFFGLAVVSAAVLAVATAFITTRLVQSVAAEVARREDVRHNLAAIARDQHDVKSLLSTATLNADRVRRTLETQLPPAMSQTGLCMIEDLRSALDALSRSLLHLNERTTGQEAVLRDPVEVDTATALPAALLVLSRRFAGVALSDELVALPRLSVLGGRAGLERALFHLVLNAVEGDGRRGASHVWVTSRTVDGTWRLSVEDDGPGFADLQRQDGNTLSTKRRGSGVGLASVEQFARACSGDLRISNNELGGATVTLMLPLQGVASGTRFAQTVSHTRM